MFQNLKGVPCWNTRGSWRVTEAESLLLNDHTAWLKSRGYFLAHWKVDSGFVVQVSKPWSYMNSLIWACTKIIYHIQGMGENDHFHESFLLGLAIRHCKGLSEIKTSAKTSPITQRNSTSCSNGVRAHVPWDGELSNWSLEQVNPLGEDELWDHLLGSNGPAELMQLSRAFSPTFLLHSHQSSERYRKPSLVPPNSPSSTLLDPSSLHHKTMEEKEIMWQGRLKGNYNCETVPWGERTLARSVHLLRQPSTATFSAEETPVLLGLGSNMRPWVPILPFRSFMGCSQSPGEPISSCLKQDPQSQGHCEACTHGIMYNKVVCLCVINLHALAPWN